MTRKRPTKADLEARAELVRNAEITRKLAEMSLTEEDRQLRERLAREIPEHVIARRPGGRLSQADRQARAEMVRNAEITRKLVERRMTDEERRLREQLAAEGE